MSKMITTIVATIVLAFAASPVIAKKPNLDKFCAKHPDHKKCNPTSVPELSAAAAPISIALVGGLLAFGLERRRKQNRK